jgi:hypothetical protein
VYVPWSLWGQNGKSWVAHFSNLVSESVGKLSDLVITGRPRRFIQSGGIEVVKKVSGQKLQLLTSTIIVKIRDLETSSL